MTSMIPTKRHRYRVPVEGGGFILFRAMTDSEYRDFQARAMAALESKDHMELSQLAVEKFDMLFEGTEGCLDEDGKPITKASAEDIQMSYKEYAISAFEEIRGKQVADFFPSLKKATEPSGRSAEADSNTTAKPANT